MVFCCIIKTLYIYSFKRRDVVDLHKRSHVFKALVFAAIGIILGSFFIYIGDSDDSPPLGFIGVVIAVIFTMRGIYYTGVIRRGYHIPVILVFFSIIAFAFPFLLIIDGEIKEFLSVVTAASMAAGSIMIVLALGLIRKNVKNHKNRY